MSASHVRRPPLHPAPRVQLHPTRPARTRIAFFATLHDLLGAATGELIGLVVGRSLGWGDGATIALAVALAATTGLAATVVPLRRRGLGWGAAVCLARAAGTASLAVLGLVANAVLLLVPGAMDAPVGAPLFWSALALACAAALLVAWPVNRWLIAHGDGPALLHGLR